MSARYRRHGQWRSHERGTRVSVEVADLLDTRNGTVYPDGAYRVLVDGKPVRGKGGTHPFMGETAWMDADRLAWDVRWNQR